MRCLAVRGELIVSSSINHANWEGIEGRIQAAELSVRYPSTEEPQFAGTVRPLGDEDFMYPGFDGFLGTRASFMLDVVSLAMFVVVPVMAWSVYLAKGTRNYALHKRVQLTLGAVLLVAVTLFEIDIRLHGWAKRAAESPFWASGAVQYVLWVHLFFAISTTLLWILVIYRALKNFSSPPVPGAHSVWHKRWGWVAAIDMVCTSVTGWTFYWMAFAAK